MSALEQYINNARYLIVDDEPINVRLLEFHLQQRGRTQFASTTDPRKAMELFRTFQPDIVLLDLMMPHVDGFTLLQLIREILPQDAFVPVIVLTADVSFQTRKRALQLGARDFLLKPFDICELDLRIHNLLEARFLHTGLQQQNRRLEQRVGERTKELEKAVAELCDTQRQVVHQARLRAFAEMAGGVAHDFNEALTVMLGYCGILLEPDGLKDPDKVRRELEVIYRAAQGAAHIVERLRRFYRPRDESEEYGPVDLCDVIHEVVELTEPKWKSLAQGNGIDIDLKVEIPPALVVQGHGPELREMLLNLVFNAVDSMPVGGRITLKGEALGDWICLRVRDTGIGMNEEVQRRCLEPFFTTKGESGTGLGLAVVFGILQRHEGTIDIESKEGEGTTFIVTLPTQSSPAAPARRSSVRHLPPLRILFADDDANVRELIPLCLESLGHTVTVAEDGAEALDLYRQQQFDVVLTDLSMPRLNGEALAAAIKQISANQPVIILTGFGDLLLKDGKKPSTVDLLLSKPITMEGLAAALAEVISEA